MKPTAEQIGFGPRFSIPLLIGVALNPINTTTIAVALDPIARATGVTAATCIWLVAVLYITSAVCQPLGGKLADQFGPRRVFMFGAFVTIIAGIIPTFAATFRAALIARILIGIGTSCAYPAAMAFIADQSVRLDRPAPQTLLSAVAIAALVVAVVGPTIGGVLILLAGWKSVFTLNIAWGACQFALALVWLPADHTRPMRQASRPLSEAIDTGGIILFIATLGSMLFFLLDIGAHLFWLLPVALITGIALVFHELRCELPFLDLRMFAAHPPLTRTFVRWFLIICFQYLVTYGMSQWMQSCMGLSSAAAGLVQLPSAVIGLAASLIIARHERVWTPIIIATVSALACGAFLLALTSHSPLAFLILIMCIYGIPYGLSNVANQAAMYVQAPIEHMGNASGLQRTCMHTAAVVASCIIGLVYGTTPSDAGVHVMALIILLLAASALLLTVCDKQLRGIGADG